MRADEYSVQTSSWRAPAYQQPNYMEQGDLRGNLTVA
jgi:hypothetical protein